MRIAIIGKGVVGAFANHAIQDTMVRLDKRATVDVFSPTGEPTYPPPGAFYLHHLPGSNPLRLTPETHLEILHGENRRYYAGLQGSDRETSADRMPLERSLGVYHPVKELIDIMWRSTSDVKGVVTTAEGLLDLSKQYDMVVNTVNISQVRPGANGQRFQLKTDLLPIFVDRGGDHNRLRQMRDLCAALGVSDTTLVGLRALHSRATVYNCTGEGHWLRMTWVRDNLSIEMSPFAPTYDLMDLNLSMVGLRKIASNHIVLNVTCAHNVVNVGRWATWNRKELSHEAYHTVQQKLMQLLTEEK